MSKNRLKLLIILIVILSLEIFYFSWMAPRTPLRKLIISANFEVLESDIYQLTSVHPLMPIMQIDVKEIEKELQSQGMIQEAHVRRGLFGRLLIQLKGYNPSVALITSEGGILFLDQNGYLFNSSKKTGIFPPILQGAILESEDGVIRLHSSMQPLLNALARLKEFDNASYNSIAGIRAITKANNLLYWEISFIDLRTKALLASYLKAENLQRALIVLKVLEAEGYYFHEVDFRTNEIVFIKERR